MQQELKKIKEQIEGEAILISEAINKVIEIIPCTPHKAIELLELAPDRAIWGLYHETQG